MAACNCIGPRPGKTLCPCQIAARRQQLQRGDCLVCGAIGGHGGLQCPELVVTPITTEAGQHWYTTTDNKEGRSNG